MQKIYLPFVAKCFFAYEYFNNIKKNIVLTFSDEETTIKAYKHLKFLISKDDKENVLYFLSLDTLPYDRISPNPEIIAARANALTNLSLSKSPKIIVTNAQNLIIKVPLPSVFSNSSVIISKGDKLLIEELAFFLVNNGFIRVPSALESGEFAIKGEIIDIVHSNKKAYRINFGWEIVESIKEFDVNSQISTKPVDKLELSSASEAILNLNNIEVFRVNFLKNFGVNYVKHNMYESIISGKKFQGYEHLLPLFYDELANLLDYLGNHVVIYDNLSIQAILELEKSYEDFYHARLLSNKANPDSFYFALSPDQLIFLSTFVKEILHHGENLFIKNSSEKEDESEISNKLLNDKEVYTTLKNIKWPQSLTLPRFDSSILSTLINDYKDKIIIICCSSKSAQQRIKNIIESHEHTVSEVSFLQEAKKYLINIVVTPLSHGFFNRRYLFISEQDILGEKFTSQSHKPNRRKLKNILTELDNITEGELVVHKEHGIGRFKKVETILVSDVPHDCLKIIYFNNDILYLPVENIDLITKYGNDEAELNKLGGVNWQKRKARLRNRIKDIAANLIKTTAERELYKTSPVNFDPEVYLNFCNSFIYSETEDQLSAINDIEADLKFKKWQVNGQADLW